jgi:hypothetical protein
MTPVVNPIEDTINELSDHAIAFVVVTFVYAVSCW